VPWSNVAEVLNALFQQNTGRPLNKDQLNYLARTAFSEWKPSQLSAVDLFDTLQPVHWLISTVTYPLP